MGWREGKQHANILLFLYNRPLSFILLSHTGRLGVKHQLPYLLATAQWQPIRVDYKVLQLLQSRNKGECADTDFVHTEIWPGWIILDAHRLSKISSSFNLFIEKEAPAPGWLLLFFSVFLSEPGVGVGYLLLWSKCACSAYMSVWRGRRVWVCVCVCVCACAGICMSVRCHVSACQFNFALYD